MYETVKETVFEAGMAFHVAAGGHAVHPRIRAVQVQQKHSSSTEAAAMFRGRDFSGVIYSSGGNDFDIIYVGR